MAKAKPEKRTKFGKDLEEAFLELAAYLRGEIAAESYEVPDDILTPQLVFMMTAYPKNERDDLSPEQRRMILEAIESIRAWK